MPDPFDATKTLSGCRVGIGVDASANAATLRLRSANVAVTAISARNVIVNTVMVNIIVSVTAFTSRVA